ncbi:macro domain-containing protein [Lentilactobacillus raoultii]|uniref:Macro domain-containing protein n=1 Tax=Lentilactobacillus raoultii TaxID=1987503 RepID=A0ABW3PKS2_9LACO|nr:macro domain-containing protein [Lentilactobacillus raoultii]
MIIYTKTSLFKSPAKVLVNTVNTVGVMGKGIALEFKRLYPRMFHQYQHFCENGQLSIGKLWLYKSPSKWILNFPTKKNWRNKSKIEYLEVGLQKFVENYRRLGITSVSFPELGTGNGGLNWDREVRPIMEKYLSKLPIRVYIHLYNKDNQGAEYMTVKETQIWLNSQPSLLSYLEVLQELRKGLTTHPIPGVYLPSSIHEGPMTQAIHVKHNSTDYYLTRFDLDETWNSLRNSGILLPINYPGIIEKNNDYDLYNQIWMNLNFITKTTISSHGQIRDVLFLRKDRLPSTPSQTRIEQLV